MAKRKVLLVVEGARKEVQLFEKLFAEYQLNMEYEIFSYKTNIYDLYERMFVGGEAEDLSLLGVLRERADEDDRFLFDQAYSDVLLIFDYDPQDDRFAPERLEEMQRFFCESTDEGKLYINYPMVEACKHFLDMPDYGYLERAVDATGIPFYKETVGEESSYSSFIRDVGKHELNLMVGLVAAKACKLADPSVDVRETAWRYGDLDHCEILARQNELLIHDRKVAVLGTSLLFIADYAVELADLNWVIRHLFGR